MADGVLGRKELDGTLHKLTYKVDGHPEGARRRILAHDAALRAKLKRCRELLEKSHELLAEEADALTADYVALRQRIREMLTELEADHERR